MRQFTILFLVAVGCGVDVRPEHEADVIAPESPRCDPSAPFGPAVPLDELNTDAQESGARLTPDELTIYFASTRPGGAGGYDLYRATRNTRSEPFSTIWWFATLATPGDERDAQPSASQSFLLFERDGDIMVGTWDGESFGYVEPLDAVNTPGIERSPWLTDDALYLSVDGQIMAAPRFYGILLPPQPVEELATGGEDVTAIVDRTDSMMFLARRPADGAATQIWSTQRDPQTAAYRSPQPLMEGKSSSVSLAPNWVSEDGCVMYLESSETGDFDIYVARRPL
jgi:hypothetical protein